MGVGSLPGLGSSGTGAPDPLLSPGGNAAGLFPTLSPGSTPSAGLGGAQSGSGLAGAGAGSGGQAASLAALSGPANSTAAEVGGLLALALALALAAARAAVRRPRAATAAAPASAKPAASGDGPSPDAS